jgi:hypothetical protein
MYVGGKYSNPGTASIAINGPVYYGNTEEPSYTNFNGGKTELSTMKTPPVDFGYYEWLATHVVSGIYNNGYQIIVISKPKGSCYDMYDFLGTDAQGENNGKTLIVFTFSDNICITKTYDGRQFGPSILAPFSEVTLTNAGYIDGIIIAKSFTTVMAGNIGSEQQLHGKVYSGPISCTVDTPRSTNYQSPTTSTVTTSSGITSKSSKNDDLLI